MSIREVNIEPLNIEPCRILFFSEEQIEDGEECAQDVIDCRNDLIEAYECFSDMTKALASPVCPQQIKDAFKKHTAFLIKCSAYFDSIRALSNDNKKEG